MRLFEEKKKKVVIFSVGEFANTKFQEFPARYGIEERSNNLATFSLQYLMAYLKIFCFV